MNFVKFELRKNYFFRNFYWYFIIFSLIISSILKKVDFHYQHSLTLEEDLLAFPIDNLKDILHLPNAKVKLNQFNGKHLRPTLFDFLSNRALSYYQQNEGRVNAPQEEFKIDEFAIFSNATQFSNSEFNSEISKSEGVPPPK